MRAKWTETTLGEVVSAQPGYAFNSDLFSETIGTPLIRIRDLKKQTRTETKYTGEFDPQYRVTSGDFLIGMDGEFRCYEWLGEDALLNQRVCRLQNFDLKRVVPRIVYLLMNSHLQNIERATSFTTVKHISSKQIENIVVWLPGLREQQRIVDVFIAVDAYIAALQQQVADARAARNAVLQELLSAGGQDWTETTLGEITNINPEDTASMSPHEEITYIDLSAVSNKGGVSDELFRGPFSGAPGRARRIVRAQDVLVSTVRPYLKGFAVVPRHLDGSIASTGFSVLRANTRYSLPEYIWAVVGTASFVEGLMDKATGSNYPAVRPSDIASHLVNLPPLAEQKRIVETVTSMDGVVSTTEQAVRVAQELRSGLLSALLSGEHEIPDTYDRLLGVA